MQLHGLKIFVLLYFVLDTDASMYGYTESYKACRSIYCGIAMILQSLCVDAHYTHDANTRMHAHTHTQTLPSHTEENSKFMAKPTREPITGSVD